MSVLGLAVLAKGEGGVREGDRSRYRLNRHEFEQTLGDSEEQGSLACCSSLGVTKSQTQLSN